ncbi:MAG: molybdopterin oxidoreductase, partial [Sphingomonadales bacterium]
MRHLPPMSWRDALQGFARAGGKRFWRGLDELLDRPDFRRALADEFPSIAQGPLDWERRDLLRCLGASLALSGLAGCEMRPDERSMPYVDAPEGLVPGKMRGYATGFTFAGFAQPVIGMTNAGRPTKIEGNPDHPASGGATDAFTQASLLGLYDPDRSTGVRYHDGASSWQALDAALAVRRALLDANSGEGLALLTGAISSPTMLRQIDALLARWPKARWHVDEYDLRDQRHAATKMAFGRPLDRLPLLDIAEVVIAFDDDPLGPGPMMIANSLGWSERRRAFQRGEGRATLLVAEPSPTLTGGRADGRLVVAGSRIPALVMALGAVFGLVEARPALAPDEQRWIE